MTIGQALVRRPVLVVAAHPDDETIGAGGMLARLRDVTILHITDGAPRDMADARAAGFENREDYAAARRRELEAAMRLAGIGNGQLLHLNVVDKEASLEMAYVTLKLVHLLRELRPGAVLTHAYEGGHPDHDAAAFAVHAACARVTAPPDVYEFASYHAAAQVAAAGSSQAPVRMETGRFLPGGDAGEVYVLDEAQRDNKRRMLECFPTQAGMLRHFALDEERFRPAPAYDFTAAPHAGTLLYESWNWGITGERWRLLAGEALKTLGAATTL
ncbi:MAG TPA: PIG-L family deacetylase [Bryobacteraceae bacterium]|nr:PIG-L family deacetylase [Bryobacteraceae bacterium]